MNLNEIVNVFCSMTGADLNDAQRESLSNLLTALYDTGYKAKESKDFTYDGPRPICDGCKTLDSDLTETMLSMYHNKTGMYCEKCITDNATWEKIS